MNKPQSNARQVQISSANRIDVARLLEKYRANKDAYMRSINYEQEQSILDHLNTLEIIFTALNVPIPQ